MRVGLGKRVGVSKKEIRNPRATGDLTCDERGRAAGGSEGVSQKLNRLRCKHTAEAVAWNVADCPQKQGGHLNSQA